MNLTRYEAFIFDCDGTLTDSMPLHYVAWRNTMARYGITFEESQFYSMAGMPSDKVIITLAGEQGVEIDTLKAMDEKENEFLANIDLLQPLTKTVEIARQFHGEKPMAVASGGTLPVVTRQLDHLGIIGLFDTIVTAEHTEKHKPEPDVFLEASRRIGIHPSKCLVFEDADLGIEAARRANMDWIDVREKEIGK